MLENIFRVMKRETLWFAPAKLMLKRDAMPKTANGNAMPPKFCDIAGI